MTEESAIHILILIQSISISILYYNHLKEAPPHMTKMRGLFGGGFGRGIIRSPQRPIRAGAPPEPAGTVASSKQRKSRSFNTEHPNTSSLILLSSNGGGGCNTAFSAQINLPPVGLGDELEWELLDNDDEREDERDCVFGSVPSADEVRHALSALQQVVAGPSSCKGDGSSEDEADWVEPPPLLCYSKTLQLRGSGSVYDAFHLLETEPAVQRMVVSLSSDPAVWDAVLNNEVVKELRGSISPKADRFKEESDDDSDPVKKVLSWIVNGKAKMMELIDNIMKLAFGADKEVEGKLDKEGEDDPFQEKLKASMFLSIIVLFVVVITRANTA